MRFLRAIDLWLAKRMFFPLIVRICQTAKCDQYRFAAYAFVLALLSWVPVIMTYGWLGKLINFGVTVLCLVVVGITGRLATRARGFWRAFAWVIVVTDCYGFMSGTDTMDRYRALSWFFMLWSEYALMIDRIPPLESKEPANVRAAEAVL